MLTVLEFILPDHGKGEGDSVRPAKSQVLRDPQSRPTTVISEIERLYSYAQALDKCPGRTLSPSL